MTAAELHPLLAHHVVNTLGWRSLRPLQAEAVAPLTAGEHALLLAPTAGGKTEAAVFPVLSRMLSEDWRGLSVLYLCPLRALLNNLEPRLRGYADLLGRRVGLWHGDVPETARERIRADPPDVLLTTPESVEAMLISSKTDHAWLFRDLQAVIVDEIHAFAGDDRGWHLLAVVQRLQRLCGREPQRIGLSATVGDPIGLLDWLCAGTTGPRRLLAPEAGGRAAPEITLDYVGSVANAAVVISRLHRGEKRLVFVDSRARAEELVRELRRLDTTTWLSHGSLGREERAAAEEAFATAPEGVIVATSTMELGIDVGDLDRVIQIDAPWTVAGFLQRLGRTGRRPGTVSSCLFLATSDRALRDTLGILTAWADGWVEPVLPPPLPVHVLVQQLLALLRQEGALGRRTWTEWLGDPLVFGPEVAARVDEVVAHLLALGVLDLDGELLQLGPEAERRYGRRSYLDLTAVFADPPTLTVMTGRTAIGQIHVRSLLRRRPDEPAVVLLAGRDWHIDHVDWRRRVVHVSPARDQRGRPQWLGSGAGVSFQVAQATKRALAGEDPAGVVYSRRATDAVASLRADFGWLDETPTTHLVVAPNGTTWWWTFAGSDANHELASRLGPLAAAAQTTGLAVRVSETATPHDIRAQLETGAVTGAVTLPETSSTELADAYKFVDVLPAPVVEAFLTARHRDPSAAASVAAAPLRTHRLTEPPPRP